MGASLSVGASEVGETDGSVIGGLSSTADVRRGAAGVVGVGARTTVDVERTVPMVKRRPWRAWTSARSKVDASRRSGIMRAHRLLISMRVEVAAISEVERRPVIWAVSDRVVGFLHD